MNTDRARIIEYQPTYVKIPSGLTKEFSTNPTYYHQGENKKHDPRYDDYSLFYDVFFDINRENIWTVGPPLLSLEKQFSSVKILYNGRPIRYKYANYFPPDDYKKHVSEFYDPRSSCSACFRIPAKNIKEKNPILTFVGKEYQFDVRVSSPLAVQHPPLALSVLQKNYSAQHIMEWVLWHYTLFNARSILLYDNGSDNIKAVKKALENIKAPMLEIIMINWNYYYGGASLRFNDLFAQYTQLNHSLRLYWQKNQYIANFDMDEFLVSPRRKQVLKTLKRNKPYLSIPRHEAADTEDNEPCGIADCAIREKIPMPQGKYIYHARDIRYIGGTHGFPFQNQFFSCNNLLYKLHIIRNHLRAHNMLRPECLYLIHTAPIKLIWKDDELAKKMGSKPTGELQYMDILWDKPKQIAHRLHKTAFDPDIHTVDRNIQSHLKDLRDAHGQKNAFKKSVSGEEIPPTTAGYKSTNQDAENWQRYPISSYIKDLILQKLIQLMSKENILVRDVKRPTHLNQPRNY